MTCRFAVEEAGESEIRALIEKNFFRALHLTRTVLPHLRAQGGGHIVNILPRRAFAGSAALGLYNDLQVRSEGLGRPADRRLFLVAKGFAGVAGDAVDSPNPPLRLPLGESALTKVRAKIAALQAELAEWERFTLDAEKVNIPSG